MISKDQLHMDLPPMIYYDNGTSENPAINVVLAYHSDSIYEEDGSNSYIPRWCISNTKYYHLHPEDFEGWIELNCSENGPIISRHDALTAEKNEERLK